MVKAMKITFINPKLELTLSSRGWDVPKKIKELVENNPNLREKLEFSKNVMSSIGILTVASVVPDEIEVEFLDECMEELDLEQNFDLVAIGGNMGQMNRALNICDMLIERGIPIVAGGAAVTSFPEEYTKRNIPIIMGEGEFLFRDFIDDFRKGRPKAVYSRDRTKNYVGLEKALTPRYDLAAKYPYSMAGVQVSRGCPYNCNFCQVTHIYGPKYRHKSVDLVLRELKMIREYWPDSYLFFYDDNPFFNKKFTIELFNRIYQEEIHLGHWGASADITIYKDTKLLDLMTQTGPISFLGIGFESLSDHVLDSLNNRTKRKYKDNYEDAIKVFKDHNVNPFGQFIFGFEGNSKEDLDRMVEFILRNEIDATISRLTPMPGTDLFNQLKSEYEEQHGSMKKSSGVRQMGIIKKFLNSKLNFTEQQIKEYMADAYFKIFADAHFCHSNGLVPFFPVI